MLAVGEGAGFRVDALDEIFAQTLGYPYLLQERGKHSWNMAVDPIITLQDVRDATRLDLAELDARFCRLRFDLLTPSERRCMRAMAELGPGPHRSGDIAHELSRAVTSVASTRNGIIAQEVLRSPAHGDTAFTVPLFDGFMRRIMPSSAG